MKITKLTTFKVAPRWLFLKVETDEGITGWGEPSLEGQANAVIGAFKDMEQRIVGQDPRQIERLWQVLYRSAFYRGGPVVLSALSGLEHACWDILGKSLGVPVYALMGGKVRDRVRLYKRVGGNTPERLVEDAQRALAEGFTAVKTGPVDACDNVDGADSLRRSVSFVSALREAVGDAVDIGLDLHGRCSPAMSIQFARAFEEFNPFFIEEPVLPEHIGGLKRVAQSTKTPIATGERIFTKWGFRDIIEQEAAAILQPDLCHCGGIWEAKKIAAMAESHFMSVAPHNPLGPICTAVSLQFDAGTPNFLIQECGSLGNDGTLKTPFVLTQDGYINVPNAPGLGIEVDEEYISRHTFETWTNPIYDTPDGFVTEW